MVARPQVAEGAGGPALRRGSSLSNRNGREACVPRRLTSKESESELRRRFGVRTCCDRCAASSVAAPATARASSSASRKLGMRFELGEIVDLPDLMEDLKKRQVTQGMKDFERNEPFFLGADGARRRAAGRRGPNAAQLLTSVARRARRNTGLRRGGASRRGRSPADRRRHPRSVAARRARPSQRAPERTTPRAQRPRWTATSA